MDGFLTYKRSSKRIYILFPYSREKNFNYYTQKRYAKQYDQIDMYLNSFLVTPCFESEAQAMETKALGQIVE